jgi:hypothetical protein
MAIILVRNEGHLIDDEEYNALRENFSYTAFRSAIPQNELVIGRYSVLPYYREVESDIKNAGSALINTHSQHRYVADLGNWYLDLEHLTPKSWVFGSHIDHDGPFVLKGETNSQRFKFKTHMFAATKADIPIVAQRIKEDSLFQNQTIWVREFVELKSYGLQVTGLPISKEFRFFICDGKVVCGGFYWSNCVDDLEFMPDANEVPREFLQEIINCVDGACTFYAVDVAQKADGTWIVIELNDGQMSGLSCIDPKTFYQNLKNCL